MKDYLGGIAAVKHRFEYDKPPRCLHGTSWKECASCARQVWCEDCGALVVLDELPDPRETLTCAACVDRMISGVSAS